jgi:hypothetical protein
MKTTRLWIVAAAALGVLATQAQAAQPATGPGAVTGGNFVAPPPDRVPVCTRDSLKAAVDTYLAAQQSGDAKKMTFAAKARYLENMSDVEPAKGLWNTALPIAFTRSFYDSKRCKTFSEVIVTEGGHPYVIGTRLYVDEGRITRIDSLVTDKGDWLFNANNYLKFSKAEDWSPLPAARRTKAQDMIDGANAYLDLFADKHVEAPWGQPCARLEGGLYSNAKGALDDPKSTCKVGIPNGVLYIVNRDYLVDEEQGVVQIYCRFGDSKTGMPDSHLFRYDSGKYRWVHTLSVSIGRDSPQVADY